MAVCGHRPAGAQGAQDPTAAGRVISTIWRVVFEREDLPCVAMDPAPPSSIPPKVLEPVGRQVGVPDRVLDVLVPEVVLQGPGVMASFASLNPQAWRSMCGWIGNGILAVSPRR